MQVNARHSGPVVGESRLALLLAPVAAVVLHGLLAPAATWYGLGPDQGDEATRRAEVSQRPPLSPPEPQPGQLDSRVSTVTWIAYDDFRKLVAPRGAVEQPAMQHKDDPLPQAPAELDPTPPVSPMPRDLLAPALASAAAVEPPISLAPPPPAALELDLPPPNRPGDVAFRDTKRTSQPSEPTEPSAPPQPKSPQATSPQATSPSPDAADAAAAADKPAVATSSPRTDREAPPSTLDGGELTVRPGGVIARQGYEIRTFAPRFSQVTLASTLPRNPRAVLTFDGSGQVTRVVLTRGSGAVNVDGPVIASLYKWRASGPRIEELGDSTLRYEVTLILR